MLMISTLIWLALTASEIPTHQEVERAYAVHCTPTFEERPDARPSRLRHLMPGLVITLNHRPRATRWNQHDHLLYPYRVADQGADQLDEWGRLQLVAALRWRRQPSPASTPAMPTSAATDPVCDRWPAIDDASPASIEDRINAWSIGAMWRSHHQLSQRPGVHR